MNDTILKFGYPKTLIREYDHWVVLLRPKQITLGSLILAYKADVESLSEVSVAGFSELSSITREIEYNLKNLFGMDKINYLALMMVDKNVHFHVIPRYSTELKFIGNTFFDVGWPKLPDMEFINELSSNELSKLYKLLVQLFDQSV